MVVTWRKLAYADGVGDIGEGHITILPYNYSAIIQGTWLVYISASLLCNGGFYNSSAAQNDQVDYQVYLAAGTYTFLHFGVRSVNYAILTLLIDGVSQGTIDLYSATPLYNERFSIAGIVVATSGLKTVSLKAATKNAASSAYTMAPANLALFRTA